MNITYINYVSSHQTNFNNILTKQYVLCICTNFQRLIDICINHAMIHKPSWLAALTCKSRTVFYSCSFSPLFFSVRTILYKNHCLWWYWTWVSASLTCLKYKNTNARLKDIFLFGNIYHLLYSNQQFSTHVGNTKYYFLFVFCFNFSLIISCLFKDPSQLSVFNNL